MKREQWKSIFDTYQRVRALLDEYLPLQKSKNPGKKAPPPAGDPQELLLGLKKLLRKSLKTLEGALLSKDAGLRAEELEEVLRPFVFLVDELVQRRLSRLERREEWPLLQFDRFGVDAGGDLFFELTDLRLREPAPSPFIYEMLHFCLTAGFKGRYRDKPAKLRDYKQQLADLLAEKFPQPMPPSVPPVPVTTGARHLAEVPYRYYVATGFFVLALPVVLWWSSR